MFAYKHTSPFWFFFILYSEVCTCNVTWFFGTSWAHCLLSLIFQTTHESYECTLEKRTAILRYINTAGIFSKISFIIDCVSTSTCILIDASLKLSSVCVPTEISNKCKPSKYALKSNSSSAVNMTDVVNCSFNGVDESLCTFLTGDANASAKSNHDDFFLFYIHPTLL